MNADQPFLCIFAHHRSLLLPSRRAGILYSLHTAEIDESAEQHPYVHGVKMAYLFVIQMGEHPDMRAAACR